jgi:hypothetical protein
MSEQRNPRKHDERRFADQCRADAERCRPAFSEALHRRIMVAVRAADKDELPRITDRRRPWFRVAAAMAASLLILAAGAWQFSRRQSSPAPADHQIAALTAPSAAAVVPTTSVTATVQNYSLDDLNRGAGLAMKLVIDRLPLDVPTDDWGLPSAD